jgi:hypothetical protein
MFYQPRWHLDEGVFVRGDAMFEQLGGIGVFTLIACQRRVIAVPAPGDEQRKKKKSAQAIAAIFHSEEFGREQRHG